MVETPMKLVDGSGQGIVAIDERTVDDGLDGLFSPGYGRVECDRRWPPAWEFDVPGSTTIVGP